MRQGAVSPERMLNIISFTKLYPNQEAPRNGVFVEARLRKLVASVDAHVKVIAPVPWFPFRDGPFRRYASYARVPRTELRHGLEIDHPRFLSLPLFGMASAAVLMFLSVFRMMRRTVAGTERPLVIDAHFLYPDGVAAVMLGKWLDVPVVMTARGNDVTLWPRYRLPRWQILWAARHCDRLITVSDSLRDQLENLGVSRSKLVTLRNGVDLEFFRVMDREACRQELGLSGKLILAVGHLIERKDHQLIIRALCDLPDVNLVIVGEGPLRSYLTSLAGELGLAARVTLVGDVSQQQLVKYYNAADLMVLSSIREGMANVMLESLACGTPVVAMNIEGVSEVLTSEAAGMIVHERSPGALASAIGEVLSRLPRPQQVREHACRFGWEPVVDQLYQVLCNAAARTRRLT